MAETITTTVTGGLYTNYYCYNRLPCGVCRIMMCQCPVQNGRGITPVPTWNPTEVTCKADKEIDNEN